MRKRIETVLGAAFVLSLILAMACTPADTRVDSQAEESVETEASASSYAEDRALIEDLQARYMFAMDFVDPETYASTFTEDGVLDIVGMKWEGREAIRKMLEGRLSPPPEDEGSAVSEGEEGVAPESEEDAAPKETAGLYPSTGRHNITNIALKIDGDKAVGRAYWFHYGNDNPERKAVLNSYGYYEDEMVKVDGQWLFSKRVIYNEQVAEWIGSSKNPCW